MKNFNGLKPGDYVTQVTKPDTPYTVLANFGKRVTAVALADMTNPCEWERVLRPVPTRNTKESPAPSHPAVGVALIVKKGRKILLQKRKTGYAAGQWGCPGGQLELWEEFETCALCKLAEEAGPNLLVTYPTFLHTVNVQDRVAGRHFVVIFMVCDWLSGEPQVLEPAICESYGWFRPEEMPLPLMPEIATFDLWGNYINIFGC